MPDYPLPSSSVFHSVRVWWSAQRRQHSFIRCVVRFISLIWQFAGDSTPSRKRQRYGDIDFDWDYRVDTTSATVGWRERFIGLLNSPYQPTEAALFHRMLAAVPIDFHEFTFIDIGSGKGRALLLASDYPFQRIIGVELLPELHRIAQENIRRYKSESQRCFSIGSSCADATSLQFPAAPLLIYLFNPLPEDRLRQMLQNLHGSIHEHPRPVWIIYHNPLLEHVLLESGTFEKLTGDLQFAIYRNLRGA